ncbi:hypothetical protein [Blastopirellula marina]|uniref:Uncharacterized protein n=1 Tax=Blastopirellula marina TaxID=124 RepID=A0A2S8G6R5_9BACT|nr:hypothetical protein [Blastopirellula marina]PQO39990.1 hypothetical protein C5Y98_06635 [Blastopirellula marina]PTL45365.1 hypothetical protein C5Y97_06635 [Blastopirellula marina]
MFEREFFLTRSIRTTRRPAEIIAEAANAFRRVGGQLRSDASSLTIRDGFAGVQFSFVCEGTSVVEVRPHGGDRYDVEVKMKIEPNQTFWVCAIAGFFCLGFLWVGNVLYFVLDPTPPYMQALDQLQRDLESPS